MRTTYRHAGVGRIAGKRPKPSTKGAWAVLIALAFLVTVTAPRAEAQAAGGVPHGQNVGTPPANGPAASYNPTGVPGVQLRTGAPRAASPGNPYGQLNYGRLPAYADAGLADGVQDTSFLFGDLHNGQWSGLIDRNFRIMRRTSPFPNQFAGGIYNRRPFFQRFGPGSLGFYYPSFGGFSYGGYAFDYGPSVYGGYVPSVYSLYGSWYPPYLPQDRVYIIERDVVHEPAQPQPQDQDSGAANKAAGADSGEYYLSPRSGESLDDALAAIRQAWMNGDFARLKTRLAEKGKVRIFLKGKYKYSVDAADFSQMTQDAMKRIDTISFTLDHVKRLSDDRAFASGEHVYNDPDHVKHEVYVSYVFDKQNGRWIIVEAGSSTEPIVSHSD